MAQEYDKILKENLEKTIPDILKNIIGIPFERLKKLEVELQVTLERKPDFMLEVYPQSEQEPFVLHIEFQAQDDPQMVDRMIEYRAIARRKFGREVRQYVIYLGSGPSKMKKEIQESGLQFSYELLALKDIPSEVFLQSDEAESVILAILADMKEQEPEVLIREILHRIRELVPSNNRISKYFTQLEILAKLRNLQEETIQIAEIMPITYDITEDIRYKQGQQQGIEIGQQQGIEIGQQQGIEIGQQQAEEKKEEAYITKLLQSDLYRDGLIDFEKIADLSGSTLERVKGIAEQLSQS